MLFGVCGLFYVGLLHTDLMGKLMWNVGAGGLVP